MDVGVKVVKDCFCGCNAIGGPLRLVIVLILLEGDVAVDGRGGFDIVDQGNIGRRELGALR